MISFIVAVGIVAFIVCFIAFKLDEQHTALKVLLIFFAVFFLMLIPKDSLDNEGDCQTLLVNQSSEIVYNYGGNFTNSVHWDEEHPSAYPSFNPSEDPIYLFHITENITYDYDTVCVGNTNTNAINFFKTYMWMFRVLLLYLGLYFVYAAFMSLKNLDEQVRGKRYGKKR